MTRIEFSPAVSYGKKKYRTISVDTHRISPAVSYGKKKYRTCSIDTHRIFSRRFFTERKIQNLFYRHA